VQQKNDGGGETQKRAAVDGDENINLKFLLMGFNGRILLISVKETVVQIANEKC
jgi:hypothetical protein